MKTLSIFATIVILLTYVATIHCRWTSLMHSFVIPTRKSNFPSIGRREFSPIGTALHGTRLSADGKRIKREKEKIAKELEIQQVRNQKMLAFFDELRQVHNTKLFDDALAGLRRLHVTHDMIPLDVGIAIGEHYFKFKQSIPSSIVGSSLFSMSEMRFDRHNFSNEVITDLLSICTVALPVAEASQRESLGKVDNILGGLAAFKLNLTNFDADLITAIDKSLELALPGIDSSTLISITQSLAKLQFTWFHMSQKVKDLLQAALFENFIHPTAKRLHRLFLNLIDMQVKYHYFTPNLQLRLVRTVDQCDKIKVSLQRHILMALGDLEVQWGHLTVPYRIRLEQAAVSLFRSKYYKVIDDLVHMKLKYNECTPYLKVYLTKDVPKGLLTNDPSSVCHVMKMFGDMRIPGEMITMKNQELLLGLLIKHLPKVSDEERLEAIDGLVNMQPAYDELPPVIKLEVDKYKSRQLTF